MASLLLPAAHGSLESLESASSLSCQDSRAGFLGTDPGPGPSCFSLLLSSPYYFIFLFILFLVALLISVSYLKSAFGNEERIYTNKQIKKQILAFHVFWNLNIFLKKIKMKISKKLSICNLVLCCCWCHLCSCHPSTWLKLFPQQWGPMWSDPDTESRLEWAAGTHAEPAGTWGDAERSLLSDRKDGTCTQANMAK